MIPILHGALFGLLFVFTFGPTFFTILQSSLSRGFKAGAVTALGVSLCDIAYATIASLGLASLIENDTFSWWLAVIGGGLLFLFGVASLIKKPTFTPVDETLEKGNLWQYFVKGLIINGINPFVIVFWMSIIGLASVNWGYEGTDRNMFVVGMLVMIFSTDLIKSFLANRLRRLITPKRLLMLNRVIGVALIVFSGQLFYSVFFT